MSGSKESEKSSADGNRASADILAHAALSTERSADRLLADIRQANEKLVIAALKASAREDKLAEAHRKQRQFVSMLAHELRNPLAPIAMSVKLLGTIASTTPEIQVLQCVLARQTAHLTRLVDDLMDDTRIQSGRINIHRSAVLLSQLIAQAVEMSEPGRQVLQQPVRIALPQAPVWIQGDFVRLTQLLTNLLINASKFSGDHSPIDIAARLDGNHIMISIKDQGIGIAPEHLPFVFDLFTQGPTAPGSLTSGLGIGLSLVKTIAQLHGGHVTALSDGAGRGSEFLVSLPTGSNATAAQGAGTGDMGHTDSTTMMSNAETAAPPAAGRAGGHQPKHILLIDDNEDINRTLSQFLESVGHRVDCAPDGAMGLHMQDLHRYDVICCDIGLPGMSGYQVAETLRERQAPARLIAISGYSQPHQVERAHRAGFDHYLVKPIFGEELLELLAHVDD